MELTICVGNIINSMREYQRKNNIKNKCVRNAQYLYDTIRMNSSSNVKVKAVLVYAEDADKEESRIVAGHLVLVLEDETIIDPSYDIFSLKNKVYSDNINDFMNMFKNKDEVRKDIDIKYIISRHIDFMKFAERINNGECPVSDKKYYNDQADYIESLYK